MVKQIKRIDKKTFATRHTEQVKLYIKICDMKFHRECYIEKENVSGSPAGKRFGCAMKREKFQFLPC